MDPRSDDPRREHEERALRSVRNLVDEIEAEDRTRTARAFKSLLWVVPIVVVAGAAGLFLFSSLKPARQVTPKPAGEMQLSKEALDQSRASYRAGPRRAVIGATVEPRFASYVENCLAKVVRVANSKHKAEVAAITGQAQLTMAVRFDGIIEAVEVHKSSGHDAIEPTAKRLVRMADTCGAFPEEIRRDVDVLQITRTFEFGAGALSQRP